MRVLLPFCALALASLPGMAVGQGFTGNWGCVNEVGRAGILTIYGGNYGYASATYGSTASGTGTITGYTDGVQFNDGALRANAGIVAGRIIEDPVNGTAMQLETESAVILLCTPL
jgi:hypothetical protein